VRDVAKQEQAVKNAQLIAAIVEFSDDAIVCSTLEGVVTSWNPAAERMYGYSGNEVISKSGSLLAPEDRASEMNAVLVRVKDGETVEHLETTLARKDGTVVPVSLTIAPIRDEDGAIVGICTIHRDVTEQTRAFEVAQRMEAIVESSDDAIIALTLEGIVTSWNPAAERLFGYTTEEIIGKPAETVTPKDRPEEIKDILAKVKAGQHIDHLETIRVRKDGSVFPVSLTVSPIRNANDATVGVSMISRNMTELRHAVRYARSLIEAALDPLVTISPEGKITDVNEASIKVTGVPRDELIGTEFSQYFTDPDKAHEGYKRAFAQGSLIDYPLTLIHQDGTLVDVLYNASVYRDFNDNVLGVVAVARDAAQLRQQQELSGQLQEALESRIVIEQAKGITAQRHGITIDQAYKRIRTHARNNNASLRTVAEAIVEVGLKV
jgi:PAS domain S-box-containing protein